MHPVHDSLAQYPPLPASSPCFLPAPPPHYYYYPSSLIVLAALAWPLAFSEIFQPFFSFQIFVSDPFLACLALTRSPSYIAIFGKHSPTALGKPLAGKGLVKLCLCHMAIGFYLLGSSTEVYNEIVAWWSMVNSSWASSLRIKRWGAMAKSSREGGYSRWVRKGRGYFGLLTTLTLKG